MYPTTPTYPSYIDDYQSCPAFKHGSRLVYGTSGLGGVWGEVLKSESIDALLYAFQHGVTALDTSPSYSMAETYVGEALKRWDGPRPFISTKVGRLRARDAHTTHTDYSSEGMKRSFYNSLETLGVDKVDLLFLHEPQLVPLAEIDRILEVLQGFKTEGLAGSIGVGGNPTEAFLPFVKKPHFDVVSGFLKLDACNLSALKEHLPHFRRQGIAYYAASALHFSLLGNRYESLVNQVPDEWITAEDQRAARAVKAIADQHEWSLPSLAQRYLFSIAEADRVVIGARTPRQIEATLADWRAGKLPRELFEQVSQAIIHARMSH